MRPMLAAFGCLTLLAGGVRADAVYSMTDFVSHAKFDAHVHVNTNNGEFMDVAAKDGFEILSINVDYPDFPPLERQAEIAHELNAADPKRFHFATTFSMHGFEGANWTHDTIEHIDAEIGRGALAVKVWKNIGMVEKNLRGQLIMLDDPGFDGVVRHLEERGIPLIAHQAEPKNCWLPLDQMTTENDRSYFRDHPEYYMYLHPDQPRYEDLMAARDRFVARHPPLHFIGAHMASLEWSVDELSKFLDAYPNATIDLAARMTQVQFQSKRDVAKVRRFFITYQDRILYGTDLTQEEPSAVERAQNPPMTVGHFGAEADAFWRSDWKYLATAGRQRIDAINTVVGGLALPKPVIDKIYYSNAQKVFRIAPTAAWQPAAGHVQIALWPDAVPGASAPKGAERTQTVTDRPVAGKPWTNVSNVSQPTLTVYSPPGSNTGAAVVVFPGGGYVTLAIDLEGTEVCDWLTAHGITCVLMKYRVPNSGPHWEAECDCHVEPTAPLALQDAQRTIGWVRLHAPELHIDPHKIGVLGFSAGGHLVAAVSTHFTQRLYPAVDAADALSCRPDFGVALYPGHMKENTTTKFQLNPRITVTQRTPPQFLLQAEDDPVDEVDNSLVYFEALKRAGVAAELHIYGHGGHAFGLRQTAAPITKWPELVLRWLETLGVIGG